MFFISDQIFYTKSVSSLENQSGWFLFLVDSIVVIFDSSHVCSSVDKLEFAFFDHLVKFILVALLFTISHVYTSQRCYKVAICLQRCMNVIQALIRNVTLPENSTSDDQVKSIFKFIWVEIQALSYEHTKGLLVIFLLNGFTKHCRRRVNTYDVWKPFLS